MARRIGLRIVVILMVTATMMPVAARGADCRKAIRREVADRLAKIEAAGWLGIVAVQGNGPEGDYEVREVLPGSPGEAAGIEVGDVLTAFKGIPLLAKNAETLAAAKKANAPGVEVVYTVRKRSGEVAEVPITLGKVPSAEVARLLGLQMMAEYAVKEFDSKPGADAEEDDE